MVPRVSMCRSISSGRITSNVAKSPILPMKEGNKKKSRAGGWGCGQKLKKGVWQNRRGLHKIWEVWNPLPIMS